jgi:hypothetical protein
MIALGASRFTELEDDPLTSKLPREI